MKEIIVEDPKKLQEKNEKNTKPHIYDSPPTNIQEHRKGGRIKHRLFFPPFNKPKGGD